MAKVYKVSGTTFNTVEGAFLFAVMIEKNTMRGTIELLTYAIGILLAKADLDYSEFTQLNIVMEDE